MEKNLDIYCDASETEKDIGIGILFIENEDEMFYQMKTNKNNISKFLNIEDFKNSIVICEGFAILLALKNIKKNYNKITLYTDCMTNFERLNHVKMKKKAKEPHNIIIQECLNLMKIKNIEIRWIKGHAGVYGNVIADKLSKHSRKRKKYNLNIYKSSKKYIKFIRKNIK